MVSESQSTKNEEEQSSDQIIPIAEKPPLFVGLNLPSSTGSSDQSIVESSINQGYDMITSRITSRQYRKNIQSIFHELEQSTPQSTPFFTTGNTSNNNSPVQSPDTNNKQNAPEPSEKIVGGTFETEIPSPGLDDVVVFPGNHISNTIALASPWVEIDSKNPRVANLSLQVLEHEINYSSFCGLPYVLISGPKRRTNVAQYAQAVKTLLNNSPYTRIVIHLPFNEEHTVSQSTGMSIPPADYLSVWEVWNTIRTLCGYPSNLSVALQVPKQGPKPYVISRWFTEPVTMLIISSSTFVPNPKGFPVLPKAIQTLFFKFFKKNPFIILEDPYDSEFTGGDNAFLLYMRHLYQVMPQGTACESFAAGYSDILQSPLQPLIDNLESSTYEVFERDPVKYDQYERAIYKALSDRSDKKEEIKVAVVGAGRGPLVERALKAAQAAEKKILIYAVEKNDSAFVYLSFRQRDDWGDSVKIIKGDMRSWKPSHYINIVISELLGSFGDNELSPECLDGIQSVLDPNNGTMIPSSYSTHITPMMSPKLYSAACSIGKSNVTTAGGAGIGMGAPPPSSNTGNSSLNSPYVVMLQQVDQVSDSIQLIWRFKHPSFNMLSNNQHNARSFKGTFYIPHKCVLHGIAGYFETTLYKDIQLSTCPETMEEKSKDMISWFPIWFPLSNPLYLLDDSEVDISFWRLTDGRKVWYEWAVETYAIVKTSSNDPNTTHNSNTSRRSSSTSTVKRIRTGSSEIHNSGGRFYAMML